MWLIIIRPRRVGALGPCECCQRRATERQDDAGLHNSNLLLEPTQARVDRIGKAGHERAVLLRARRLAKGSIRYVALVHVDVLGLDSGLCEISGPMERLRSKLANEPQVHSNKQTRLVFTDSGETSVRRERL